jgi:hypothetical protein
MNSICYVMPESRDHYAVSTLDHRQWWIRGEGNINNPPSIILGSLIQQGAVGREGKRQYQQPGKKTAADQMADIVLLIS